MRDAPRETAGESVPDPTSDEGIPDPAAEQSACAYTEYRHGRDVADLPATGADAAGLEARIWDALYDVEDPEMPVSIVDLGLIYGVAVDEETGRVEIDMTLTYTGCPARTMLLENVEDAVEGVEGVDDSEVELVWSPEWTVEMVTDDGQEALREFGVSI
jgi:metal-sulfur cluster biosynthetic enzyme